MRIKIDLESEEINKVLLLITMSGGQDSIKTFCNMDTSASRRISGYDNNDGLHAEGSVFISLFLS